MWGEAGTRDVWRFEDHRRDVRAYIWCYDHSGRRRRVAWIKGFHVVQFRNGLPNDYRVHTIVGDFYCAACWKTKGPWRVLRERLKGQVATETRDINIADVASRVDPRPWTR